MTTSNHLIQAFNCENTHIQWNDIVKVLGEPTTLAALNASELDEPIDNYEKLAQQLVEIEPIE
jgi:hypothetical protein